MSGELIIELKELQFFSYHGLFREEKKVGGEFAVDVAVKFTALKTKISKVDETVNYVSLYEIVKEEMNQPTDLLETVAQTIAEKIHQQFSKVTEVKIKIVKKNPPIINFPGSIAVVFEKKF